MRRHFSSRLLVGSTLTACLAIGAIGFAQSPLAIDSGRVTVAGSSNVHTWTASTTKVRITRAHIAPAPAGTEFWDNALKPGALDAFEIAIPAATLASPKGDLDKNMYKALKVVEHPKTSIVRERTAGRVVVEQEAVSRTMMFSKRVHLLLEITSDDPGTLRFRDRCGRSFARYEGSWRLSAEGGGTTIVYELTANPSFDVPEFILKRLLKRDSAQMIAQLAREMAVRAGSSTIGAGAARNAPDSTR